MKIIKRIIVCILIISVALGAYIAGSWIANGQPPTLLKTILPAESRTVVVMGMDAGGTRSDVLMVAFIDGKNGKVSLLSVPRDTRVKIGQRYHKINSAHAIGGHEQTIETLEGLLGIEIDNYVKFSFETFKSAIDALGGVDYNVPQDMQYSDPYQDLEIDLKAGMQHLDGEKAEQLVRFRQYPMGDEDRIAVQQDFIKELVKQKLKISTFLRLPKIISEVKKNIETDIEDDSITALACTALKMQKDSFKTYKLPGGAQRISGLSYYIMDAGETEAIIEEIKK